MGDPSLLDMFQRQNEGPNELDEDGWSCIEYAEVYRESPLDSSFNQLIQSARLKGGQGLDQDSSSARPGPLHEPYAIGCVSIEPMHENCMGVHGRQSKPLSNAW